MIDTNRARKCGRILEVQKHYDLDKKTWFYGEKYAMAVYQNGKFIGYKNPGYQGSIVLNASFPKVKAGFLGLGKCKNVVTYILNTSENEFRFSVSAKTKNGKNIGMAGICKFSVTDMDIEKFLSAKVNDYSDKPVGYVGDVIKVEKLQSLIGDTFFKTSFTLMARDHVDESEYKYVAFPNDKAAIVARDMAYYAKVSCKDLGLTLSCEVFPDQLNK